MYTCRYSEMVQWADESIAYYTWHKQSYARECGHVMSVPAPIDLATTCGEAYPAHYLCEREPEPEDQHQRNVPLKTSSTILSSNATSAKLVIPSVACREGHLTHVFLACDAKTSCWLESYDDVDSKGFPSVAVCPAPLTSLPPSFSCIGGSELVPYSVVCDHRYDCADSSDEYFCVFPPCTGNAPLQCSYSRGV